MPQETHIKLPDTLPDPFGVRLPLSDSPTQVKSATADGMNTSANIRGQAQWEKHMRGVNLQRRYQKVSVIMVHWEKDKDEEGSVDAQDEIDQLSEVLRKKYRFTVRERKLNREKNRSAQIQIHHHIAEFVYDEDDDETLLVIYYAGHGTTEYKTNRLIFARGNMPAADEKSDALNYIVWQEAERLIHSTQRADIFLILDCCHAGRLIRTRQSSSWSNRIFEFLGAAGPDQTTPLPGPDSFTSALIFALNKFAEDGESFTSSELLDKICYAPHFNHASQLPCLSERAMHSSRRLILEPLAEPAEKVSMSTANHPVEEDDSSKYCLNLQFLLPKIPSDEEYKNMCDGLIDLIRNSNFIAQQVLWRGLYSREHTREEMPRIAREMILKWQNQALQSKLRSLSNGGSLSQTSPLEGTKLGLATPSASDKQVSKRNKNVAESDSGEETSSSLSSYHRRKRRRIGGLGKEPVQPSETETQ